MSAVCVFCRGPINPQSDYRKVTGWERQRSTGLRLRQPHDEWACRWCIDKEVRGIAAQQQSLLGGQR